MERLRNSLGYVEEARRSAEKTTQRLQDRNQKIIQTFGEKLGPAFIHYTYGRRVAPIDHTASEQLEDRRAFAETLSETLETGYHEDRVRALTALLTAIDEKVSWAIAWSKGSGIIGG